MENNKGLYMISGVKNETITSITDIVKKNPVLVIAAVAAAFGIYKLATNK